MLALLLIVIVFLLALRLVKMRKEAGINRESKHSRRITFIGLLGFSLLIVLFGVDEYVELKADQLEEANDPDYSDFDSEEAEGRLPSKVQELKNLLKIEETTKDEVRGKLGSPTYSRSENQWAYSLGQSESFNRYENYYKNLMNEKVQYQVFIQWRFDKLYHYDILWAKNGQIKYVRILPKR